MNEPLISEFTAAFFRLSEDDLIRIDDLMVQRFRAENAEILIDSNLFLQSELSDTRVTRKLHIFATTPQSTKAVLDKLERLRLAAWVIAGAQNLIIYCKSLRIKDVPTNTDLRFRLSVFGDKHMAVATLEKEQTQSQVQSKSNWQTAVNLSIFADQLSMTVEDLATQLSNMGCQVWMNPESSTLQTLSSYFQDDKIKTALLDMDVQAYRKQREQQLFSMFGSGQGQASTNGTSAAYAEMEGITSEETNGAETSSESSAIAPTESQDTTASQTSRALRLPSKIKRGKTLVIGKDHQENIDNLLVALGVDGSATKQIAVLEQIVGNPGTRKNETVPTELGQTYLKEVRSSIDKAVGDGSLDLKDEPKIKNHISRFRTACGKRIEKIKSTLSK